MQKLTTNFLIGFLLSAIPLMAIDLVRGPYLQDAQSTEITVMWETELSTAGKVRFGTNERFLTQSAAENEARTLHQIKLENLKPDQDYYYQCIWKDGKTTQGKFRTAPADNLTALRIAVVGDSRSDLAMSTKISNMIIDKEPGIVIHTGDLVANGRNLEEWNTYLFEPMEKLLRNSPLYSVLGNHEQESPYYYNYFPLHNQKPWWSVDYGSVHLIGLDTSVPTDSNSEQYQFLLEDLKKNKKPWTIVVFHHPLFHSHPYRPIQEFRHEWQSLFMEYDVDLVLTGHDHYYHRTFPIGRMAEKQQGVVHITTAGGGANLYPTVSQPYSAYDRSLYHYLLIDVTEDELEIRAIDENNQTFDAIILNKYQDHSASNFVEYGMFEIEQELNNVLGGLTPKENKRGVVFFDTTITVETDFYIPVSGTYQWQTTDSWKFDQSSHDFTINPGEKLQIRLKARVNKKDFMPTPELSLHLAADNSSRNISEHRPYQKSLGFVNQDLQFSIEEATYKSAVSNATGDLAPYFSFLKYYANSEYAEDMLVTLGNRILNNRDENILPNLEAFLTNNPSDLNKYRIYPFYFLFEDFTYLEEWMDIIGRLPSDQLSFAPKLICQLADLDIFNSRMIESWNLLGPFDAPDWQGLSTDYGPEIKFDLEKEYDSRAGTTIAWNKYSTLDYKIDLIDALGVPAHASSDLVAYAHTELDAVKEGEILLLFGSDDDPVVWVNGIEVHRKRVGRGLKPCQDILVVPVKAGKNDILIKVVQRGGAWSLDLRVSDWKSILTRP